MLCCETGGAAGHDAEDLAVFVSQLNALGVEARVDVGAVPEGLGRNAQFDLAPYLRDHALGESDRVVVIGAHRLSDQKLNRLRRLAGSGPRDCRAFGTFKTRQAIIGAKAKLSYVFGQDPEVFDLAARPPHEAEPSRDCPLFGVPRCFGLAAFPRVLLVAPDLRNGPAASALTALALSRRFRVAVLSDGSSKQDWVTAHGRDIPFYHYGEILPTSLAERVDVCVVFTPLEHNYRLQCLVANLAVSGATLVDATAGHAVARTSDAFVRGPTDLLGLALFLAAEILPNLADIAAHARSSQFAAACDPGPVLRFLDAAPQPRVAQRRPGEPARIVFVPTNGVGLGHAQRCALIAAELDRTRSDVVFAAFPSCVKLVKSYGFDVMPMIGRSAFHAQTHENDRANYLRLRALSRRAQALVFDGGYVFDSIYRTVLENRLEGVWIRRGLWQGGQHNSVALDREKAFSRVIVPREAFEEINAAYSRGDHLREVGPVVQRIDLGPDGRRALRARLAARFERGFDRLVVSLLGAGVAADRGAQIQALCGMMERRSDTLHLVVVWPTAVLQPAWFAWSNSRVVRTQHVGVLAAAADICVSAAGYNSFHEALYNRIPTIFIPQMSAFMDDQQTRARAAKDRGLAGMVEPGELMALEREIGRFLDGGEREAVRDRIAALDLPEPGNIEAARLIEEVTHGRATLDRHSVAHSPARRG